MTQSDCHRSIAFDDLSPRPRGRGLVAAALLAATVLVGCATAPPAKTMDETVAQIRRDQSEIHLFGDFADCLNPPLSEAQKKYLLSGISLYKMQHYVRALPSANAKPNVNGGPRVSANGSAPASASPSPKAGNSRAVDSASVLSIPANPAG